MDPSEVHGKRIAIVVWGTKPESSGGVAVFAGLAQWNEGRITMRREPDGAEFPIPEEWLPRLQAVKETLRETLLEAEFTISVTAAKLSEAESAAGLVGAGSE